MTDKRLTREEAAGLCAAVLGEPDGSPFATGMPEGGDVALVFKHGGGVQILSVMADNPNPDTLASLGIRGMFAMALFKVAHNADLMAEVIEIVSGELENSPAPKLDS